MMCGKISFAGKIGKYAFTRIELTVVIASLLILAGILATYVLKTKNIGKTQQCLTNLKKLGQGMALYRKQNDDKLPVGYIHYTDSKFLSWDSLIAPGIQVTTNAQKFESGSGRGTIEKALLCPQDTIPAISWRTFPKRRTYSIGKYDMTEGNWPPSKDVNTSLGLHWGCYAKGVAAVSTLPGYGKEIPSVRGSFILEPEKTILLTEHAYFRNLSFNSSGATIGNISEHISNDKEAADTLESLHGKAFNYLQFDGHVDTLSPKETIGLSARTDSGANKNRGMWTIKAGD